MSEIELIATIGLPGCGKTTLAREYVAANPHTVRINRDDIRYMLWGIYFGPPIDERTVTQVQFAMISAALNAWHDVYVDDTNLSAKVRRKLTDLAEYNGAKIRWVDLTDVPLETCIARDAARDRQVGEDVIRDMHKRYLS